MANPTPQMVKEARGALTQKDAALLIDAKERTWQDWEGGRRKMPMIKYKFFLLLTGQLKITQNQQLTNE